MSDKTAHPTVSDTAFKGSPGAGTYGASGAAFAAEAMDILRQGSDNRQSNKLTANAEVHDSLMRSSEAKEQYSAPGRDKHNGETRHSKHEQSIDFSAHEDIYKSDANQTKVKQPEQSKNHKPSGDHPTSEDDMRTLVEDLKGDYPDWKKFDADFKKSLERSRSSTGEFLSDLNNKLQGAGIGFQIGQEEVRKVYGVDDAYYGHQDR